MVENRSPWLEGLSRKRPITRLDGDLQTQVAVVGGGIAGISTAFFLLQETEMKVTVLEKDLVAHGATGHNGGQVVAAFEKSFLELAEEFGELEVAKAYLDLANTWNVLWKMIEVSRVEERPMETVAHLGFSSLEDILLLLEERELRLRYKVPFGSIAISNEIAHLIPEGYRRNLKIVTGEVIKQILGTKEDGYCCVLDGKVGVMNSAAFTEQLASYLCDRYPKRLVILERTKVEEVELDEGAVLSANGSRVKADFVVLCTNGYKDFKVRAPSSALEVISSVVGFQTGYWKKKNPSTGVSVFFPTSRASGGDQYFYLTKRPFFVEGPGELSSLGGPEWEIAGPFEGKVRGSSKAYEELDEFYRSLIEGPQPRDYEWQGLMGYSKNHTRIVGADPRHPALLYNLACNGIGILSSLNGAQRIPNIILGAERAPAIYDPSRFVELRAR